MALYESQSLEEKRKQLEKQFLESRPPLAYAKLHGRDGEDKLLEVLITQLPTELGRGPQSSQIPITSGPRIALGEYKAISRTHAKITWNALNNCMELQCLGKNGLIANGQFIAKDQIVPLTSKIPIQIGPIRFYFLKAIRTPCSRMTIFKFLQRTFQKTEKLYAEKARHGLLLKEIYENLLQFFPNCADELGERENFLRLIQFVLFIVYFESGFDEFVREYMHEDRWNFEVISIGDTKRYRWMHGTGAGLGAQHKETVKLDIAKQSLPDSVAIVSGPKMAEESMKAKNSFDISNLLVPENKKPNS